MGSRRLTRRNMGGKTGKEKNIGDKIGGRNEI